MADSGTEYFAAFDDPGDQFKPGAKPWAVFKVVGAQVERYVPQRSAYVPVRDHFDFIAIGYSSDANATREVTEQEATAYLPDVRDVADSVLAENEKV